MNNRKYITYSKYFEFNGHCFEINTLEDSGCFTKILKKGINIKLALLARYKRIFVYFFGLHSHQEISSSKHVSRFFEKVKVKIRKLYHCDIGYLWVRELNIAIHQHYHAMLVMDGDVIRHSNKLAEILKSLWQHGSNGNNTINFVKRPYYKANSIETLEPIVLRFSYYAKESTKGRRPTHAKDYGSSRIKL